MRPIFLKTNHVCKTKVSKYKNKRTTRYGINFASIKEADYYDGLLLRHRAGEISYFLRQVPFHLPGGVKYLADFLEVYPDGKIKVIDVKGFQTNVFKLKKKQVEALYPVKIEIV
jgi:hypothetical protein